MMMRSLGVAAVIAMVTSGGTAQAQETLTTVAEAPDSATARVALGRSGEAGRHLRWAEERKAAGAQR